MAVLTEEQSILRDAARTWTREQSPVSALRRLRDNGSSLGYDPAAYAKMAEMGWTGVIIPEAYGGSNFGYLSLGLVLEETGRTLTASPLLSSALAAPSAILEGGDEAQRAAWLPQITAGDLDLGDGNRILWRRQSSAGRCPPRAGAGLPAGKDALPGRLQRALPPLWSESESCTMLLR